MTKLKSDYEKRRRQIYRENAVYIAPGGCIPATEEMITFFNDLEPGEFLILKDFLPPKIIDPDDELNFE